MSRLNLEGHRNEMSRMQRSVRRQVAAIQIVVAIIMIMVVVTGAWLVIHPEAIGGFLGRIVAGFSAGRVGA